MLRAEPAEFFCFYRYRSFTVIVTFCFFLGTLVANDAKIVHFTFHEYFPGARTAWGHDVF